jgi:hypothetical protein
MTGDGFLAIWSDLSPESETDYLHWLTQEHVAERLSVPGFLACRVFRADTDLPRYFIIYTLRNYKVLCSSEYIARLNDPSDWSQSIMRKLFNFKRGGGTVRMHKGWGSGGLVAALVDCDVDASLVDAVANSELIVATSLLQTDRAATDVQTREKKLREQDNSFNQLLLIEGLTEAAVAKCVRLTPFSPSPEFLLYRQVFAR